MDRKSQRVAALTFEAGDLLAKGEHQRAEVTYKLALAEAVRLLGLCHALTRNVLSLYAIFLRTSHRHEEAIRHEALYWKTARTESYRLGVLFGSISPEVQEFLETNGTWVESWGKQLSVDSRRHGWNWDWGKNIAEASLGYFRSLRQYVVESGK